MDIVLRLAACIGGIMIDYLLIKLAFEIYKFMLKLPKELPKRAQVEGIVGSIFSSLGFSILLFYHFSWKWFLFVVIFSFGFGGWARLELRMLEKLEWLRYNGKLSDVNWFHRMFYRAYLRKIGSDVHDTEGNSKVTGK